MTPSDARRTLPSVDRIVNLLVADDSGNGAERRLLPRSLLVQCARRAVEEARGLALEGREADEAEVLAAARAEADEVAGALLHRVVNATGVLVHTNLGRAPLDRETVAASAEIATGYSNLELSMDEGRRGSRHRHAGELLARACGAEAGIVVNNNAAAVLLALAALARDREVVVSRGELVEIGGGFRIPEVMAESGARLVEVGTTNRTRLADYRRAIGPDTALLLKVHASNYRIVGFAESVDVDELAGLGPPVVFDAGSGLLDASTPWIEGGPPPWLDGEPGVRQAIDAGAGAVTFSGDKLLGGPQAGVIVGRRDLLEVIERHPLARAVRADKVSLAMLQAVALAYLDGRAGRLPLWRMMTTPVEVLQDRARVIAGMVAEAEVVDCEAVVGGGSLPGGTIPSAGVALDARGRRGDQLAAALRRRDVVARIEEGRLVCDLRSVDPADDEALTAALAAVVTITQ